MGPERRKALLLAALVIVLLAVVYWQLRVAPAPIAEPPAVGTAAAHRAAAAPRAPAEQTLDVHLKALAEDHPKPMASRNLFRFQSKSEPARVSGSVARARPAQTGPPPPPPISPIPLAFIGIVEASGRSLRIAVLRDPLGHILNGSEGAIIDGRYQILRIGAESIEMAYLDGSGRQTIRLSGG